METNKATQLCRQSPRRWGDTWKVHCIRASLILAARSNSLSHMEVCSKLALKWNLVFHLDSAVYVCCVPRHSAVQGFRDMYMYIIQIDLYRLVAFVRVHNLRGNPIPNNDWVHTSVNPEVTVSLKFVYASLTFLRTSRRGMSCNYTRSCRISYG